MNNCQLLINDYPLYNEELIMEGKKQRIVNYQLSIKNYPLYKDSAIDWIGEIPEHWDIKRLKDLGFLYSGLTGKAGSDFTNEHQWSCDFIPFVNIANNQYISLSDMKKVIVTPQEKQNQVKKHDLFFLMSSENYEDIGKTALLRSDIRSTYLNSFCKGFRFTTKKIEPNFANYLFSSRKYRDSFAIEGKGFTRINLKIKKVNNLFFLLPPLREQVEIAHYLDTKTAQIDRKIDLLTQKAKRYEELKRVLINETVTRSLDKSVPMKDSAIEWIGEIPEHWEVNRLKDIARQSKEKNGNTHIGEMLSVSGYRGIEFKKYDDELKKRTDEELSDYRVVRPGQLVVNTMWLNYRGIGVSKLRGYVSPAYRAYFLNKTAYGTFIHYLMRSDLYVSGYSKYLQGIRPNSLQMKTIDFECLPMLVPPLPEQEAIAHYLDTKTAQIDQIIQTINTQVEKLQELRKTLINDVVTGKIKVIDN